MKHLRRYIIAGFGVGVLLFSPPVYAQQSSLYYQTTDNANTGYVTNTGSTNVTYQQLGTGLTGVVNEVSYKVAFGTLPTLPLGVDIAQCDNNGNPLNNCTNFVNIFSADQTISSTSTTQYFTTSNAGYSGQLDPSKYYFLVIYAQGETLNTRYQGSSSSGYSGGDCVRYNAGVANSCTNINDLFFVLNGVQTTSDTSYTSNLQPANASTTASTQVSTSFQYHAVASQNITSYAMLFHDITQDEDFTIQGAASTGDATISRVLTLTSGHAYNYVAYICSSGGTCYGGPTVTFSVVTSSFGIGVTNSNGTSTNATSTGIFTPTGVGSVLPLPNIISDANATSSLEQGGSSFINIPSFLANKFPFSWMYEIGTMIKNASSSSTTVPTWTVDFSNASTTAGSHSILAAVGPITIMSTGVAEYFLSYDQWQALRTIAMYMMWVGFAYWFLGRVMKLTI